MTTELLRQGRYEIERVLGRGGMGTVHLARDTVLGRCVAVKVLAEHLAADDAFRQRFLREARLTAQLCHPNIVQVFDAGDDGAPFLVMEYVDGETVADRLARGGRLTAAEVLTLAVHLSAGLAHAHERGIVHRDVKPHNVLLRRDGVAKLTDFGIARALEESGLTEAGTAMGTARFMAPEQAGGRPAGPPADVYGLGAVLRHVGAGELSPALSSLVDACLAPDPTARPSATALHERLTALADAPALITAPRPAPSDAPGLLPAPPVALPGTPMGEAAPTELAWPAPTQVAPPGAAPVADTPDATSPDRNERAAWAALLSAAALLVLLSVFVGGRGDGGDRAEAPPATPVTTTVDPATSARNLADWLRRHGQD